MTGSDLQVYSVGLCYASVCVPKDLAAAYIERWVNRSNPTGIDATWHIANEPFHTGHHNPCLATRSEPAALAVVLLRL